MGGSAKESKQKKKLKSRLDWTKTAKEKWEAAKPKAEVSKLDEITDWLKALSIHLAERPAEWKKPSKTQANVWCIKCYQSGHAVQDCPKMKPHIHQVELKKEDPSSYLVESIKYFLEDPTDKVY